MSEASQITARSVQIGLYGHLYHRGWRYFLPNVKFFGWESDYLGFSPTGQIHEFEIKLTRADFKADMSKVKHAALRNGRFHHSRIPNYFTFVLPPGVGRRYEVPDYAGVLEWSETKGGILLQQIRPAKELTPIICCEEDFVYLIEKSNEKLIKAWRDSA